MIKLVNQDITDGFQWSTSEQVYPFEKDSQGRTLYCKEIDFGVGPNGGIKTVAHSISNYDVNKLFSMHGFIKTQSSGNYHNMPVGPGYSDLTMWLTPTDVNIYSVSNWTIANMLVRIIYAK